MISNQPLTQQQDMFAQRVGALPSSLNSVDSRAVGLPETTVRLQQQMQYWLEQDGAETTASAAGAKAAEKTRRYIQHLMDRGGAAAPRCPIQTLLDKVNMRLRVHLQNNNQQEAMVPNHNTVAYDVLSHEEQCSLATLTPLSYAEALNYVPSLGRFEPKDVEETLALFRV